MTDQEIEAVARSLCRAAGADPDRKIETGEMEAVTVSMDGGAGLAGSSITTMSPKRVPAWTSYSRQAREFILAADALASVRGTGG